MSIRKNILIPMIALTALCSAAILASSILLYNAELNDAMKDDIHVAAMSMMNEIEHAKTSSYIVASAMSKNIDLTETIKKNNRTQMIAVMNKILAVTDIEFCTVINSEGIVLARTHLPDLYGDDVTWQKSVVIALSGTESTVVERGTTVMLSIRSVFPIFEEDGSILGVLTLGYRLDTPDFVKKLNTITGCEITIFFGNERIITTIKDDYGEYAVGTTAADDISKKVMQGEIYFGKSTVLGREMITEYIPLYSAKNEVVGMMSAAKYTEEDKNKLFNFIFRGIIITLIILAITAVIAIFISNFIDHRINGMLFIVRESEELKKLTRKLDKRLAQQSLMAHISQNFLSNEDIDTLLSNALREVGEFMGIAQILLYKTSDDDEHTIICRNGWMNPKYNLPSRVGGTIVISDNMLNIFKSLKNPEKFYVTAADPGVKEEMANYRENFYNYLTAGILIDNKLYAVVDFSRADNDEWNRYEIQIASFTANIITGVLQKHVTQKQLINAKEIAEQSSRYKTEFLTRMSHEIRTPMNAIIGMTELALRENTEGAKNEHVYTVKQAASNLLSIINDILDFSKIEAGKLEIVNDDYSVTTLLNDIISIARMRAADSEVRFAVKADSKIPSILFGDETRIRQSVLNILNNAVKYTDKGYVSFGIYCEFIDKETVNLIFEVTDTGIGIKNEDLEKLFTDFTQFDLERNRGIEGVGLGLAITRGIVEEMGGEITVKSEYGKGSTFTISLPQTIKSQKPLAKINQPEEKKVLILIYERRDVNADALVYTLNNLNVDCTIITKGTQLYEKMSSHEYNYLFIPFVLYKKNEDTIIKFGKNTKTVIITEFGSSIPEKNMSVLVMPVYCTHIADIFNGVSPNQLYTSNNENNAKFTAPEAKILIVDDINTNLKVAEGLLVPYNMKVDLCNNGRAAIETVREKKYDIVFMDHKMPGMDGVAATCQIRQFNKELPIIALTANAVSGMMEMFIENGFNDFLSKPIETVKLNAILEKWIPKDKQVKK